MAKRAAGTAKSAAPAAQAIPISEANRRIAKLCRLAIQTNSEKENLDRPVDGDIEISGDERAHKIVLKVDGVEVSWCVIVDFQQQIGSALVRMGGLAGVGTHDQHRFKGYSRRVLLNSLRWERSAGYDVAMLYGISGFYPRFGYVEAFPAITQNMMVRDAELATAGEYRFVDCAPEHLPAVLKMYHANNAGRTGVTQRDPKLWTPFRKGNPWGPQPVPKVALDSRGKPAAYFAYDAAPKVDASVLELGYTSPAVFGSLLREIASLAWAARVELIQFHMPEDDAFMSFCRQFGMRKETLYRRDGGAMVRMINVTTTFQKIAPVLAKRLANEKAGTLTLRTNLDDVGLSWGGGRFSVGPARSGDTIRLPQWALAQLLYGYQNVETLAFTGAITGSKAGIETLGRMFPQGPHYHYKIDSF